MLDKFSDWAIKVLQYCDNVAVMTISTLTKYEHSHSHYLQSFINNLTKWVTASIRSRRTV